MTRNVRRLHRLHDALARCRALLILTHDNPDPDSIASAWVLGRIARRFRISRVGLAYGGIIGRTENRTLIDMLRIPLKPIATFDVDRFDAIALVDTQPQAGNNSLPIHRTPAVVFDHHPCRRQTRRVPYSDVRADYGATTTILYEYFIAAGMCPDRRLATVIFHAIRSETQNLGRDAGRPDAAAFVSCFPLVDNRALSRVEHAVLPRAWFAMVDQAIDGTAIYGEVAVTRLGEVASPDMVAQFADLIVRLEGIGWVLAIGRYRRDLLLSIRTNHRLANAGRVIGRIVGTDGTAGGHDMIAGGKLSGFAGTPVQADRVERLLVRRLLKALRVRGHRPTHLTRSLRPEEKDGRVKPV